MQPVRLGGWSFVDNDKMEREEGRGGGGGEDRGRSCSEVGEDHTMYVSVQFGTGQQAEECCEIVREQH
jgi:hypothetical protein